MKITIKTLKGDVLDFEYTHSSCHSYQAYSQPSFYKMVEWLCDEYHTTSVQCVIGDMEGNIFYKDDVFYAEKWNNYIDYIFNKDNENLLFFTVRPMMEIQTVKNDHLHRFLAENDKEMRNWDKETIVWFDLVGNRIYSVRYTGHPNVRDMFSIHIEKFVDESDQMDLSNCTPLSIERFQYIVEGLVK